MTENTKHISVLTKEILSLIAPKSGGLYLDGTFGGGGHSEALLNASSPSGRVIALDKDIETNNFANGLLERFGKRFEFRAISYLEMSSLGVKFDGIVLDLGLSTDQLKSNRGFSFVGDQPLDMRFDTKQHLTAADILNRQSAKELQQIFQDYAQDRYSKRLSTAIVEQRRQKPFRTTEDLIESVGTDSPHVLAPIFQALRIVVNDELNTLQRALGQTVSCLKDGGVLAVMSFHSLEDRIVKNFFRENKFNILTKKPIMASETERGLNPASRSAKLRAGIFTKEEK